MNRHRKLKLLALAVTSLYMLPGHTIEPEPLQVAGECKAELAKLCKVRDTGGGKGKDPKGI